MTENRFRVLNCGRTCVDLELDDQDVIYVGDRLVYPLEKATEPVVDNSDKFCDECKHEEQLTIDEPCNTCYYDKSKPHWTPKEPEPADNGLDENGLGREWAWFKFCLRPFCCIGRGTDYCNMLNPEGEVVRWYRGDFTLVPFIGQSEPGCDLDGTPLVGAILRKCFLDGWWTDYKVVSNNGTTNQTLEIVDALSGIRSGPAYVPADELAAFMADPSIMFLRMSQLAPPAEPVVEPAPVELKSCKTCADQTTPTTEEPCNSCHVLNNWTPKPEPAPLSETIEVGDVFSFSKLGPELTVDFVGPEQFCCHRECCDPVLWERTTLNDSNVILISRAADQPLYQRLRLGKSVLRYKRKDYVVEGCNPGRAAYEGKHWVEFVGSVGSVCLEDDCELVSI